MFDRKIKQFALRPDYRTTTQIPRHRNSVESCRHYDDQQIAPRPLQSFQQCQRKIAFQMALVEFIEHHRVYAFQLRIREKAPCEHALGDKAKPRARANRFFKPNLVPDGLADRFAAFRRDSTRRQARCYPARLQHDHISAHHTQQSGRHSSGLARTRSGYDHQVRLQF